jgi:hypothetical protein
MSLQQVQKAFQLPALGEGRRQKAKGLSCGRTIWITDAHRDDGKRFVVHADEKLTAFVELESAIRGCGTLA